jgi:hypothetical protein
MLSRRTASALMLSISLLPTPFVSVQTIARERVFAASDPKPYPGDYIAFCTPVPAGGCICGTESQEQTLTFPEFSAAVEDYLRDAGDPRYARLLDQFRRQCAPSVQTASPR